MSEDYALGVSLFAAAIIIFLLLGRLDAKRTNDRLNQQADVDGGVHSHKHGDAR